MRKKVEEAVEKEEVVVEQEKLVDKVVEPKMRGVLVMLKIYKLRNMVTDVESSRMDSAGMHYNYLSERALTTTIRPKMQELGLVAVPVKTVSKTTAFLMGEKDDGKPRYVLLTEESKQYLVMDVDSGDYIIISVEGSGADTMDKGTNKAETCAKKNFYKELLNLPSPDREDPDTTPSTGSYTPQSSGYGSVGDIKLKFGVHAGKTIKQLYEEDPTEVQKMAKGNSKWLAEKAQAFLKSVNAA